MRPPRILDLEKLFINGAPVIFSQPSGAVRVLPNKDGRRRRGIDQGALPLL